jgi:hypothetical protein
MLKAKDGDFFVTDWLRNRNTLEYIGIWEQINNPKFNYGEFATIRNKSGLNSFKISVGEFVQRTNYHIHTDAVKQHLVPKELTPKQASAIYADEADVLNVSLFGMTAKEWRTKNHDLKGNIRDYASINELICLSNMENINAVLINDGIPQKDRLLRLNKIAIQQMTILVEVQGRKLLK